MAPVIEGPQLEKILAATDQMKSGIYGLESAFKESTVGAQAVANTMGAMIETVGKARYSFYEFTSQLEKTHIVMYSLIKTTDSLSQGLRSATSGVEGLVSAFTNLTTRTLPDITKKLGDSAAGWALNVKGLEAQKTALEGVISGNEKDINITKGYIDVLSKKKNLTNEDIMMNSAYIEKMIRVKQETSETSDKLGDVSNALDQANEKAKVFSAGLQTFFGWATVIIAATVALAQAYDNAIKAKREVIYTLGRMGASYSENTAAMDKFEQGMAEVGHRWGMLKDDMAKAIAPLSALGVGVGPGGAAASLDKIRTTMESAADWTGGMMRAHGIETGITTRALGTMSTAFNIRGKELSDTFAELYTVGEKSALGLQGLVTQYTSLIEITRRYGGTHEAAITMLSVFSEEIKKGTVSVENLARMTTPAMWSLEQQGAVTQLMRQLAPQQARELGITGKNVLEDIYNLQLSASKEESKAGVGVALLEMTKKLVPPGAGPGEQAILMSKFLSQLTGTQVNVLEVMNKMASPEKLAELIRGPGKAKTPEDIFGTMKASYIKTIQESLVGTVDVIRDKVTGIHSLMYDKWGPSQGGKDKFTEENMAKASAAMETKLQKQGYTSHRVDDPSSPNYIPPPRQTGGYISETAGYLLHAGEQVRRPGEGGGGNISISLGGLSITVGDRGDLRNQLDEAFGRMKQETLKEIENQWTESLIAH